jgi:hypothetical protein
MALFAKANKNYVNLPLSRLKQIHKKKTPAQKKMYRKSSISARKFQNQLLGIGSKGPIKQKRSMSFVSTTPMVTNKPKRKLERPNSSPQVRSLPNRLRPKPDMRNKKTKAYGYVNAQNNMVLLGGKFDPYGVRYRNSINKMTKYIIENLV